MRAPFLLVTWGISECVCCVVWLDARIALSVRLSLSMLLLYVADMEIHAAFSSIEPVFIHWQLLSESAAN